jgi:hypothetical protein
MDAHIVATTVTVRRRNRLCAQETFDHDLQHIEVARSLLAACNARG